MKRLCIISSSLKYLFESIELLLRIKMEEGILSKILDDYEQDLVNEKSYRLNSDKDKIKISALVEEHEPGSIILVFENIQARKTELEELFEEYEFAFGLGASYRSPEESLAIYQKGIRKK